VASLLLLPLLCLNILFLLVAVVAALYLAAAAARVAI
jgi:hypothetical protein